MIGQHNPTFARAISAIEHFRKTDGTWKDNRAIENLEQFTKDYAELYEVFQEVIDIIDSKDLPFTYDDEWIDTSTRIDRVLFGNQNG